MQFYSATVYLKMTTRIATLPIHAESIMSAFPGRGVPETVEQPLRRQRRRPPQPPLVRPTPPPDQARVAGRRAPAGCDSLTRPQSGDSGGLRERLARHLQVVGTVVK